MSIKCPVCGYQFKRNMPGIDTRERPYFKIAGKERGEYVCSSVCMSLALNQCKYTEPKNPDGYPGGY